MLNRLKKTSSPLPDNAFKPTADDKRQHLAFIQAIISRLSDHCKVIKMGTVTFLAGVLTYLAAHPDNIHLSGKMVLCYAIIILALWILDSSYLRQERLFRKLYNEAAEINNPDEFTYKMNVGKYVKDVSCIPRVMVSITIWPIYTFSLLILIIFNFPICKLICH